MRSGVLSFSRPAYDVSKSGLDTSLTLRDSPVELELGLVCRVDSRLVFAHKGPTQLPAAVEKRALHRVFCHESPVPARTWAFSPPPCRELALARCTSARALVLSTCKICLIVLVWELEALVFTCAWSRLLRGLSIVRRALAVAKPAIIAAAVPKLSVSACGRQLRSRTLNLQTTPQISRLDS